MSYFLLRLNPPRPSFAMDMTDEEQALMGRHAEYWRRHFDEGRVVVFGPVMDPAGGWGMAVVQAGDEAAARELAQPDPVIRDGRGFSYDVLAMPATLAR